MDISGSPLDQTAAATSLFAAVWALGIATYLTNLQKQSGFIKINFWIVGIFLLGASAFVAVVLHGLPSPGTTIENGLWRLLDFLRILAASMFLFGLLYEFIPLEILRRVWVFISGTGLLFYLVAALLPDPSIVIALYETLAMLPIFILYSWLATRFGIGSGWWMSIWVVLFVFSAWLQVDQQLRVELVWLFDSRGISNLLRLVGVLTLAVGLRSSLFPSGTIASVNTRNLVGHR